MKRKHQSQHVRIWYSGGLRGFKIVRKETQNPFLMDLKFLNQTDIGNRFHAQKQSVPVLQLQDADISIIELETPDSL